MKTILYHPYKEKEYIYDVILLEIHIFRFFLKLIRLLWNFKTASLLTPSLTPENFNSIGSVVFEISYVKISKSWKWEKFTELYPYIPEWWAAAAKRRFMFASPRVGSRAKNKIHNITMFILVDIYEDILEYYVQVRIII